MDISEIKAKEWIHSNQNFCQHNLQDFFFFLVWGLARTKLNIVGFVDSVGIFFSLKFDLLESNQMENQQLSKNIGTSVLKHDSPIPKTD